MLITDNFDVRVQESPDGVTGDFISSDRKVHFFVDKSTGAILTSCSAPVQATLIGEMADWIEERILHRR